MSYVAGNLSRALRCENCLNVPLTRRIPLRRKPLRTKHHGPVPRHRHFLRLSHRDVAFIFLEIQTTPPLFFFSSVGTTRRYFEDSMAFMQSSSSEKVTNGVILYSPSAFSYPLFLHARSRAPFQNISPGIAYLSTWARVGLVTYSKRV